MTHAQIQEVGNSLISDEHTELLMQVAAHVGRKLAYQYPTENAEDIASEVTTQAIAEWKHNAAQLAKAANYGRSEYEVLFFLLSRRANEYCGKRHYAYMLENPQAAVYTPREVRALLKEFYFNPDAWETPSKDTEHGVAVDAKSLWVNLADLKSALERVSDRVHETILAAFGPEDLNLPEPDKRRVSDAVGAVTRELNRHLNPQLTSHEGPGRRKAMPTETAVYITHKQGV
ncbi:hypothetical protein [Sphaerisporangium siamense]|uniref:Uncharacterized protein n=1 Tax=Sphaerisporangium siamense TaxID=795645 RepID=A0A7W7GBW5_9ACTN|nr:hypothetical protein [Sphaerisporangium siamense]MBB4702894.1 hypothetical protein [Sphaerisporangium siamense]